MRELKEAVQKEEEDTRTEKYLILPDEINGTKSPGVMRKFRNCRNPYSRGGQQ